ncbi:hypothetical protein ACFFL1_13115 [Samsonia erythrinae]|uniref:Uncharacterized protein n=1 Tax=Samsonia erythrinae TaxID=160434 RepID=A0A4R3VP69_9GAMM|nr:hypothetical protein [Samsonia erythrinae]TCV04956.1 hypothetical protein EDC54_108109 [Samsonia erythrinae]
MGILNNTFSLIGKTLGFIGDAESNAVTSVANAVATAVSGAQQVVNGVTDFISDVTEPMPVVNGVVDAAANVINGATHGVEIVTHHFTMWGAEAGQAIGTVLNTTGDFVENIGEADLQGAICAIRDGIGEIVGKDLQYISAHLDHDAELIQIPIKVLTESVTDILKPIFGDNCITNLPSILDDLQNGILEGVILDQIVQPLLDCLAEFNESIFGYDGCDLSASDMGMGFLLDCDDEEHNHHYSCDDEEHNDHHSCEHVEFNPCEHNVELVGVNDGECFVAIAA